MASESGDRNAAESVSDVAPRQAWEDAYSILCSNTFLKDGSIVMPLKWASIVIVGAFRIISPSSSMSSFLASLLSSSGISNDHSFLSNIRRAGGVLRSTVVILVFWSGLMAIDLT